VLETAVLNSINHRFAENLPKDKDGKIVPLSPMVNQAKPEHGDYQCTISMSLAKKLKLKPKDVAETILQDLRENAELKRIDRMDISGPGFINLHLSQSYVQNQLQSMMQSPRLGVASVEQPQKVVVDFSSPNIAKEMHVVKRFHYLPLVLFFKIWLLSV
jgi:arginyl-tRNA synthetase